jgi:hypothetical protein
MEVLLEEEEKEASSSLVVRCPCPACSLGIKKENKIIIIIYY